MPYKIGGTKMAIRPVHGHHQGKLYFSFTKHGVKSKRIKHLCEERENGFPLKTLRTDREGEYVGCVFETFLKENDTQHQLTARYTPQQNGVVERKIE